MGPDEEASLLLKLSEAEWLDARLSIGLRWLVNDMAEFATGERLADEAAAKCAHQYAVQLHSAVVERLGLGIE